MSKAILDKKTSELKVSVVAKKNEWKEAQENAFKELAKNVSVKGFRKGHVPEDIVKKHVSDAQKMEKALSKMLDKLVKEAAKEIKDDVMILDSPTYKVDKISNVELEITFIYPVFPEFKISDYKNLGIKYKAIAFKKEQVKDEIKKIQKSQGALEEKKGAIANGDTVIFDFEGKVDGKLFDGGKAEKYTLEIGSGQFIPGFEDQMIGLKKGDEKDLKVTFPKDYHAENLKGKEAVFKVKIHEIKSMKLPELDNKFVKSLGVKEVDTVEKLETYMENLFKEQNSQKAKEEFQRKAFDKIIEKTEIVVPMQLISREMKKQEKEFNEQLKQQGLTIQQYIEMTGMKPEKLQSQFKQTAEKRLKESIIFAEIAKKEKIEIKDKDYEAEYKKLAKVYGQSEESIKGIISKEQMQIPMTNDRVIDILIDHHK